MVTSKELREKYKNGKLSLNTTGEQCYFVAYLQDSCNYVVMLKNHDLVEVSPRDVYFEESEKNSDFYIILSVSVVIVLILFIAVVLGLVGR